MDTATDTVEASREIILRVMCFKQAEISIWLFSQSDTLPRSQGGRDLKVFAKALQSEFKV